QSCHPHRSPYVPFRRALIASDAPFFPIPFRRPSPSRSSPPPQGRRQRSFSPRWRSQLFRKLASKDLSVKR
ncbi:hypothetical protein MUK42_34138, partial [Musa troglodytarum]